MNDDFLKYIIVRILEYAKEAAASSKANPDDDFNKGKRLAFYQVLSIIQNESLVEGLDMKSIGIDIDIDREIL